MLSFFLILFACYLLFYLFLIFFLKNKYEGYSVRSHVVSFLATADKPWNSIFNGSTFLYGVLSMILPVSIIALLGVHLISVLGSVFLLTTGVATALVGIFPMDTKQKGHQVASILAFSNVMLTGITFAMIFRQGALFSPPMQILNFGVIGLTCLLAMSAVFHKRTSSLFEWLSFLGTIVWNFLLSMLILARIYPALAVPLI